VKYTVYGNISDEDILKLIKAKKLKIGISGSRKYYGQKFAKIVETMIVKILEETKLKKHEVILISGGAKGIDTVAEEVAEKMEIDILVIRPDYRNYPPKIAPLKRNKVIAELSDVLIAIPALDSKGTYHTIGVFRKKKPENKIITVNSSSLLEHFYQEQTN